MTVSASQVAQRMNIRMTQPHLVWNPSDGQLVVMMEADRENRYLYLPAMRKTFAILVVANDSIAFTDYSDQHLMELLTHIPESIPNDWPMGPPSTLNLMQAKGQTKPGHYTEDQLWANARPVGRLDIKRLRRQV